MDESETRKIMFAATNMNEMDKEAFICRIFGYMELMQTAGKVVSADEFFQVAKEEVERLTKGSEINAR